MVIYDVEYTDTCGGEANYCWVRRAELEIPDDVSDLALVRRAKAAVGITGTSCRRNNYGDMIELRPYCSATILFITPRY